MAGAATKLNEDTMEYAQTYGSSPCGSVKAPRAETVSRVGVTRSSQREIDVAGREEHDD